MAARRLELSNFLGGAAGGAAVALIYLWPLPFTLRGTLGVLVAGAIAGVALAAGAYLFRHLSGLSLYGAAVTAGALGGAGWWLVVRPPSAVLVAALVGAVMVAFVVGLESSVYPRVR